MSSSRIDLIFNSRANLTMESGVHSSLHANCHYQAVLAKFNLSILYPPHYERIVWFYEKADPESIQRAINEFERTRALSNVNLDEKVCYFTKTLLNIIYNFMPHGRIVCDDRNPPWINNDKKLISEKNSAYKSNCRFNRDMFLFKKFKFLQNQLNVSIEYSKQSYYSKFSSKLANPASTSKMYWSILKTFLNDKMIPCIPPLFHENKFTTNFKEKT